MKHIASLFLFLYASVASAATIVPEPKTPSTSESTAICTKYANKRIAITQHLRLDVVKDQLVKSFVSITFVDGKKVFQREESGSGQTLKIVLFVKDTTANHWLRYEAGKKDNPEERHKKYLAGLGITEAEYESLGSCFASTHKVIKPQ